MSFRKLSEKHNSKPCRRICSKSTVSFHILLRIYCVEVEPFTAAATNSLRISCTNPLNCIARKKPSRSMLKMQTFFESQRRQRAARSVGKLPKKNRTIALNLNPQVTQTK